MSIAPLSRVRTSTMSASMPASRAFSRTAGDASGWTLAPGGTRERGSAAPCREYLPVVVDPDRVIDQALFEQLRVEEDHLQGIGHLVGFAQRAGYIAADNDIGAHIPNIFYGKIPYYSAVDQFFSAVFHGREDGRYRHAGPDSRHDISRI